MDMFVESYKECFTGCISDLQSTNELAKLYAINPSTAAKGINILVDAGILYKKRGIGMFVSDGAKEVIRTKRKARFC